MAQPARDRALPRPSCAWDCQNQLPTLRDACAPALGEASARRCRLLFLRRSLLCTWRRLTLRGDPLAGQRAFWWRRPRHTKSTECIQRGRVPEVICEQMNRTCSCRPPSLGRGLALPGVPGRIARAPASFTRSELTRAGMAMIPTCQRVSAHADGCCRQPWGQRLRVGCAPEASVGPGTLRPPQPPMASPFGHQRMHR